MRNDRLTRAWAALLALSAASSVLSLLISHDVGRTLAGAAILLLAWLKARVILARYLGLWQAPQWLAGFVLLIGLYCLLLLGLFLAPALTA